MLDSIKEQVEKLKILYDDPEAPKLQLLGLAPRPLEVSFPRIEIFIPAGGVLGLLLGIGLAFLIEVLNDLVRTPRDVARYLHIPLLGMIPDAAEDDQVDDDNLALAVRQAPFSLTTESYRRLRTNLKLSGPAGDKKVLLVTSGAAEDGRTTVAVNLATTFVADGNKVLLIDANFRRPALHKVLPAAAPQEDEAPKMGMGLSDVLLGRCTLEQIVRSGGIDGLSVLDAGLPPVHPAELLGGPALQALLTRLRDRYDYVVLDGPPVLVVSETKLLARAVDGSILIFNAAATKRGVALRTITELREVDAKIVGCVLTAVQTLKGGYFREHFRLAEEYGKMELAGAAR